MINPLSTLKMSQSHPGDFPLNNPQSIRGSSGFTARMPGEFIELLRFGMSENTKNEIVYGLEPGSEFGGVIINVEHVDV